MWAQGLRKVALLAIASAVTLPLIFAGSAGAKDKGEGIHKTGVEVSFRPMNDVYDIGDPILYEFRLVNNTGQEIIISNFLNYQYLDLHVYNEKGEDIKFFGWIYDTPYPGWENMISLCSGCYWGKYVDLVEHHGNQQYLLRDPGTYTVKGVYRNMDNITFLEMIEQKDFLVEPPCTLIDLKQKQGRFWGGEIILPETTFTLRVPEGKDKK